MVGYPSNDDEMDLFIAECREAGFEAYEIEAMTQAVNAAAAEDGAASGGDARGAGAVGGGEDAADAADAGGAGRAGSS